MQSIACSAVDGTSLAFGMCRWMLNSPYYRRISYWNFGHRARFWYAKIRWRILKEVNEQRTLTDGKYTTQLYQ